MTRQQLSVLNSLVTFAAENIPGGLSEEEREVAKVVGAWVLDAKPSIVYEYKTENASYHPNIRTAANHWGENGWRLVTVISDTRPGYAHSLVFEREIKLPVEA